MGKLGTNSKKNKYGDELVKVKLFDPMLFKLFGLFQVLT